MSIDITRLESQLRADADVLRVLAKHGDIPSISRSIDVRFIAEPRTAKILECEIEKLGWLVLQTFVTEDGMLAVDAQVEQTTDVDAISRLTRAALEIEARTGAQFDGWQTAVKKSN